MLAASVLSIFLVPWLFVASQEVSKVQNQPPGPKKTLCNINNYNSFYAGSSKKVDSVVADMKKKLDAIETQVQQIIPWARHLMGNSTAGYPKSCADLYKFGQTRSGVYTIDPDGQGAFEVLCDQNTSRGGWTVIQKRLDGSVDFNRGWGDYKGGFGNLSGEFWLGLEKVYRMTIGERMMLHVDLEDVHGKTSFAQYGMFAVSSERSKYQLSLGSYSAGTAGDSLGAHRGFSFSTPDQDNDDSYKHCALKYKSGWWYDDCRDTNLNGLYRHGKHPGLVDGISWKTWKGYDYSAKRAEMKIRPVDF